MAERLLRAEKLAGLGLLAGGIAHSLNNPLTAVMGYAELIGETAEEERVRRDALTILTEARRMRETIQTLLNFWRPPIVREEPVDVAALVRRLGGECEPRLAERGVRLTVQLAEDAPAVRGNGTAATCAGTSAEQLRSGNCLGEAGSRFEIRNKHQAMRGRHPSYGQS